MSIPKLQQDSQPVKPPRSTDGCLMNIGEWTTSEIVQLQYENRLIRARLKVLEKAALTPMEQMAVETGESIELVKRVFSIRDIRPDLAERILTGELSIDSAEFVARSDSQP